VATHARETILASLEMATAEGVLGVRIISTIIQKYNTAAGTKATGI